MSSAFTVPLPSQSICLEFTPEDMEGVVNVIVPPTVPVFAMLSAKVVPAMELTTAPIAMPVPETSMPKEIPAEEATVIILLPVLPLPVVVMVSIQSVAGCAYQFISCCVRAGPFLP